MNLVIKNFSDIVLLLTAAALNSDEGRNAWNVHGLTKESYDALFSELNEVSTWSVYHMLLRPKSRGVIKL